MQYSMTIFGKKYKITGLQFLIFVIVSLLFFVTASIGLYRFGGWLFFFACLIVFGSITMNDSTVLAVIKNEWLREKLGKVVFMLGFAYFVYTSI